MAEQTRTAASPDKLRSAWRRPATFQTRTDGAAMTGRINSGRSRVARVISAQQVSLELQLLGQAGLSSYGWREDVAATDLVGSLGLQSCLSLEKPPQRGESGLYCSLASSRAQAAR
ncbi:hypothetical protein PsYK624_154200 [Phanerochaete sordida]|uniref:Uncharacterized protein n=1 Tax=Phanerochaete sordida TaxID=48140 RepID=A0A9P3GPI6_9APHY|nr:hypothetical protein PsYK624_154200 [Phanerochaete sordida]